MASIERRPLAKGALKLTVPAARPYGDDFYREVAKVWRAAADAGIWGPAERIADVNGVMPSQVHRWVKVARTKRFLERGRVGKS